MDYSTFQPTPFSNLTHRPQFDQTFPSLSYLVSQALHQIELERHQSSMGLKLNSNNEFNTFQSILPSEKENEEEEESEEKQPKPTNLSSSSSFPQDPDKLVVPKLAVDRSNISQSTQVKHGGLNTKKKKKNHSGDFLIGNLDLIERAYLRLGSLKARIFLNQLFSSSIPHFDSAIQLYGGWEALKNCVDSIPIFCPVSKPPQSSSSKLLMYEEDRSLDHFYPLSDHSSFIQALTTRSIQNYLLNGLHSETSPFYQKTTTTHSSTQGTIMELEEDGISMMTENMTSHSSNQQRDVYSEGEFKEEEMKCQHVLDEATSYMESRMKKKQRRVKNQLKISMKNESQKITNSVSSSSSNFLSTQPSSIQFSPKRRIVWSCSPQEVDDWMDSSSTITHFPTVLWSGKRFDP